ncbi:hypothetical protein BGX28_005837 [Mortierella sp. GBA30]|nr:hypothetical protein BGX28_005837 [Mortierella sp. GBA30]
MATYKQRPYQRHTATYSDDDDVQKPQASNSITTTASTAHPIHLTSHLHQHYNHSPAAPEDDILENTLDREWTSVRHSVGARAKARRQQYLDQQQQRTREWQFVLNQHRLSSTVGTTSKVVVSLSDDYEETVSSPGLSSIVTSPRVADTPRVVTGTVSGEQSSVFGFSDLTSDGLESVGESEDLGVWSHEDDEDGHPLLATPAQRRRHSFLSSSLAASSTTSLSHLPRPSFAHPHNRGGIIEPKFQNQMPFHDGSGNFAAEGQSGVRSHLESDMDYSSELGWESSSSRASSAFRHTYRPNNAVTRRRISTSEFQAMIQNIADLQHTSARPPLFQSSSSSSRRPRSLDAHSIPYSSDPHQPLFTYPHVVAKRPIFNIYESEMEDLADMTMEMPTKIGWLEAFEQALWALSPDEYGARVSVASMVASNTRIPFSMLELLNPIKALALHFGHDNAAATDSRSLGSSDDTSVQDAASLSIEALNTQERQQEVKENMSAASSETLKRLQTRKRSNHQDTYLSDPMQVEFSPTVGSTSTTTDIYRKERRVMSRSTGTSTSTNMHDTNLLEVVISTLRRFRDHVKSNLMYSEFYYEEGDDDRHAEHLSRTTAAS